MKKLPIKTQTVYAPLYHWTGNLKGVLESDMLKTGSPSVRIKEMPDKCICLTRMNYMKAADCGGSVRFVLNTDLLKLHGYQIFPTDEIQYGRRGKKEFMNIGKVMPTKGRWIHHKTEFIGLGDNDCGIEYEYEERIYKEIKNFGKYIVSIQFLKSDSYNNFSEYENLVLKYLEKYDHIKIEEIVCNELWKRPVKIEVKEKELV